MYEYKESNTRKLLKFDNFTVYEVEQLIYDVQTLRYLKIDQFHYLYMWI